MSWLMWIVVLLLVLIAWKLWSIRAISIENIAHLPTYPIVGNLLQLTAHHHDYYSWLCELHATTFKGRSFAMSLIATPPMLQATPNEALCRHILKDNFDNYSVGDYRRSILSELFGKGIFGSDGKEWRSQRKSAANIFTLRLLRDDMTPVFVTHGQLLVDRLREAVRNSESVDMQDLFFRHTMDSFCSIAFGEELNLLKSKEPHPFARAFDQLQFLMVQRFFDPLFAWKRTFQLSQSERTIAEQLKVMNRYAYEFVAHRRADIAAGRERHDLISHFMAQAKKDGVEMSDEQLRDVVINFLVAGRDTTAVALSWFMYEMTQNPGCFAKVQSEIDTLMAGAADGTPTFEIASDMRYTEAALLESLRLHPSVPGDDRTALADDTLPGNIKIKAGTLVAFNAFVYGRSEELWGADALRYKPERWLDDNEKDGSGASSADDLKSPTNSAGAASDMDRSSSLLKKFSQYQFPTFSGGFRLCMGRGLALLEAKLAIAQLFHAFDFELVPNQEIVYLVSVTLIMKNGIKLIPKLRKK